MESVLPEKIAGEYEMISCFKASGKTSAYLVFDKIHGRRALLKCGSPSLLQNEAEILQKLSHRGIPEIYGFGENAGEAFLIRQYIPGENLHELIQKNGGFPEKKAAAVCAEICEILEYLHGQDPPVIHRDIKSENIILSDTREIYIVDFGISRRFDNASCRDTQVMGTPSVAPPEQFGYGQTDRRSDIYSVGVLLHELVTGSQDLSAGQVSPRLAKIIKKCAAFSPDQRYKSAAEAKKALSRFIRGKNAALPAAACAAAAICCGVLIFGSASPEIPTETKKPAAQTDSDPTGTRKPAVQTDSAPTETKKPVIQTDSAPTETRKFAVQTDSAPTETRKPAVQTDSTPREEYYSFADKAIETEICRILGKTPGTVTRTDLSEITEIKLVGKTTVEDWHQLGIYGSEIRYEGVVIPEEYGTVSNLSDLADMPNLSAVILCRQNISDLSPLAGLNLEKLALHGNQIRDISPLNSCHKLCELYIGGNPLSDFSPLAELKHLSAVNAGAAELTDLDDLAQIPALTMLDVSGCLMLSDFSGLGKMRLTDFRTDVLSKEPGTFPLDLLNQMTSLEYLQLWNVRDLKTLSQFSALTNLKLLTADYCANLYSLEGIETFKKMESLNVQLTGITDLSPLRGNESIDSLNIAGIKAADYSPISEMRALKTIYCDESQSKALTEALGSDSSVQIIFLDIS